MGAKVPTIFSHLCCMAKTGLRDIQVHHEIINKCTTCSLDNQTSLPAESNPKGTQ